MEKLSDYGIVHCNLSAAVLEYTKNGRDVEMMQNQRKWMCVSGSMLKLLAMVTMLIDHVAVFWLSQYPAVMEPLFTVGSTQVSVFYIMRSIGRVAFPIYCFLLTEGFVHTANRRRYGLNLLLFALVSELPWNFVHTGTLLYGDQNVFFTLFFGFCALCMIERLHKRPALYSAGILLVFAAAYLFRADYGYLGVAAIIGMYVLRSQSVVRAMVCTCLFSARWRAGLAFIPIALYNGKRGFIKGKLGKYICYAFYPIHLLVLGLLYFV